MAGITSRVLIVLEDAREYLAFFKVERDRIMGMVQQAERILSKNPGKGYCAKCLGQAAGACTSEEQEAVSNFFHQSSRFTDRECVEEPCSVCGEKRHIVRKL
jgi:hypothetical protein